MKKNAEAIFLSGISVALLLQMVYQLNLPGPYYDEVQRVVYGIEVLKQRPIPITGGITYSFLGLPILGSVAYYVGPIDGYLALLSMRILGVNVLAVRAVPVMLSVAALLFLFFFIKSRFGSHSALVTTLLLAFQSSFILWSRVGLYATTNLVFYICSSLYFLNGWLLTRSRPRLALGSFLLGLGFATFISFTWYIVALVVTAAALRVITTLRMRDVALVLAGFLAGVGPYLLPWIDGTNLELFIQHARISYAGVDNLSYISNLSKRFLDLSTILNGDAFSFLGGIHSNPLAPGLFVGCLLGTLLIAVLRKKFGIETRRSLLFPVAMSVLILLQSPVTISSLNPYQLVLLTPFTSMVTGCFVGAIWDMSKSREEVPHPSAPRVAVKWVGVMLLLILSLSIVLDVSTTMSYHSDLTRTGGLAGWSSAVYDAADYMRAANCTWVLSVDWGLTNGLLLASGGAMNVTDIYWSSGESFQKGVEFWTHFVDERLLCFVAWRNVDTGGLGKLDLLRQTVRGWNKSLVLESTFYQRDGTPVIDVYRIREEDARSIQHSGTTNQIPTETATMSGCPTRISHESVARGARRLNWTN